MDLIYNKNNLVNKSTYAHPIINLDNDEKCSILNSTEKTIVTN